MRVDVNEIVSAAEKVVGLARGEGFEDVALVVEPYESVMAKFANSRVTVTQSWSAMRVTLYLSRARRVYVTELTVASLAELEEHVRAASKLVDSLQESEIYAPLPEPSGRPLQGLADGRVVRAFEQAAELADVIISAAEAEAPGSRAAGMVELEHGYRVVVTSRGAALHEEYTSVEAYARVLTGEEASGHWAYTSTRLEERELEAVGRRAAEYALQARRRVAVEPGAYPAILSPLVLGNLLNYVAWMASALSVLTGFSVFAKYGVGKRLGSDRVTVIDDPHDVELPGSTGFDDEGVATRRKPIIERGVVRTLLHNTKTAAAMKAESTGNAGLVSPVPWNVVVEPGDASEEELVAEVRRGLLVLNNWYTRFQNFVEGVFSTVTRDALLYIEGGEVKGSAARLRIADTIPNLLQGVELVGRSLYKIGWWEVRVPTKAPYVLVGRLRFTRPEV